MTSHGHSGRFSLSPDPLIRPLDTHPFPVLSQPVCWAVLVPTGVDGQRLCLCLALRLGDYPSIAGLTVHMPDGAALSTAPTALQGGVIGAGEITGAIPQAPRPAASPNKRNSLV